LNLVCLDCAQSIWQLKSGLQVKDFIEILKPHIGHKLIVLGADGPGVPT